MKRGVTKAAFLFFAGLTIAQTGDAVASVDWSWSFDPSELSIQQQNPAGITVNATVSNSSLSTESIVVGGVALSDGSMGTNGVLLDSQGGGALTASIVPSNLNSPPYFLAPGESITGQLFALINTQPLTLGEQYFAAPYFYIGTSCSTIYSCASFERALPTSPLHMTVVSVPEVSVNGMLALGLLAVAIRARKKLSKDPYP